MASGATLAKGGSLWDLFYDVNTAQPLRYNRLRLEMTLGDDRDSASAMAIVETIDLQGVVVGSRTGSANFVRIPFEPLE
jgi:trehalose-6-phosphatase